ncbi:MAG: hypothetical protein K2K27_08015 [Muribaculaceae bacterium]|nr:hypothetical protein [Muribaculaceae bacterium]
MKIPFLTILLLLLFSGCQSSKSVINKNVNFAGDEWKIDYRTSFAVNSDSSYQFQLEQAHKVFADGQTFIGKRSDFDAHPGLEKYFDKVISDFPLEIDSVLVYVPYLQLIFATYNEPVKEYVPTVISDLTGEYKKDWYNDMTGQMKDDGSEIYSNVVASPKGKRFLAFSRFKYGDQPIVMIKIVQGYDRKLEKLCSPTHIYSIFDVEHDPNDPTLAEITGWALKNKTKLAKENAKIGIELLKAKKQ